jgi:hypothetical protein
MFNEKEQDVFKQRMEAMAKWLETQNKAIPMGIMPGKGRVGFNMSDWLKGAPECGTVVCMGGLACQMFEPFSYNQHKQRGYTDVMYRAKVLLGLDFEQSMALFCPEPREVGMPLSKISPKRAAAVLRNFIATGRVDWKTKVRQSGGVQ